MSEERYYAGNKKGAHLIGEKRFCSRFDRLKYHAAHHMSGRMYWCGCAPVLRVGDRTKVPGPFKKTFKHRKGGSFRRVWWQHSAIAAKEVQP